MKGNLTLTNKAWKVHALVIFTERMLIWTKHMWEYVEKELSIKVFPLLNSNLCAVNLLETYVAFDKKSTHISNQILKNQMTVNPYQLISVPDCVFRICDALNKVQSVYKEAVNP